VGRTTCRNGGDIEITGVGKALGYSKVPRRTRAHGMAGKRPPAIESGREATSKAGRREQVGKLRSDNMGASRPAAQSRQCCGRVWLEFKVRRGRAGHCASHQWPPKCAAAATAVRIIQHVWLFCQAGFAGEHWSCAPTADCSWVPAQASVYSPGSAASWGSQLARCIRMLAAHHAA